MKRSTADIIALILAVLVAVVVLMATAASLWIAINYPTDRVLVALDAVSKLINVLVGALIGFMAGRRLNGHGS